MPTTDTKYMTLYCAKVENKLEEDMRQEDKRETKELAKGINVLTMDGYENNTSYQAIERQILECRRPEG